MREKTEPRHQPKVDISLISVRRLNPVLSASKWPLTDPPQTTPLHRLCPEGPRILRRKLEYGSRKIFSNLWRVNSTKTGYTSVSFELKCLKTNRLPGAQGLALIVLFPVVLPLMFPPIAVFPCVCTPSSALWVLELSVRAGIS